VLASGPGDGFNLTYRGSADGEDILLLAEADPTFMAEAEFHRHLSRLHAFMVLALAGDALDQPLARLLAQADGCTGPIVQGENA